MSGNLVRRLPDWLKSYNEYTALSESPAIFHFWTGVSTIASVLKRRVWIDQRYFEWTPNFYIIFVAKAGIAAKSTTISVGTSLLREIDNIHFGPDSGTWQAIGKALEASSELVPVSNAGLMGEMESMSCITCTPGELGTFLNFDDRKLIDVLTSLWDGQRGTFEHSTASQGKILIQNPWLNIISATTPSWLSRNMPEGAIGEGFASRVVFVFAEKKRQLVAYPSLMSSNDDHTKLREDLIHDLNVISEMLGEMILTPEAVEWGIEWYKNHHTNRPVHLASDRFDGYLARKQTHIHKLAMVLSVSESNKGIIERSHLVSAEKITSGMEHDMIRVFESIGVAPQSRMIGQVVNFLDTYKKQNMAVTSQTLQRHCLQIMSAQEMEEALSSAIKVGYIACKQVGDQIYYHLKIDPSEIGRPSEEHT